MAKLLKSGNARDTKEPAKSAPSKKILKNNKPAADKATTKSASKPAKAKPGKVTEYAVGDHVSFVGYKDASTEAVFEAGERLVVVGERKEAGHQILECVFHEDVPLYEADPEDGDYRGQELDAGEVKRAKGAAPKPAALPVTITDVGDVAKIVKKSGDLLEAAQDLYADINKSYFAFGGLLAHLYYDRDENGIPLYKSKYGSEDFKSFCMEHFGFKERKGTYWIDVYMQFSKIKGFKPETLQSIGWSKAAEIARYVTDENVNELVEKADSLPIVELRQNLQENYVTEGKTASGRNSGTRSTKVKKISFGFQLFEDAAEGVKMILDAADKQLGTDRNQTFETILTQWASENLSETVGKKVQRAVNAKRKELKDAGVKFDDAE